MIANGAFEVDLQPMEPFYPGCEGNQLGRMSITKTFTGDLTATSLGEMFSVMTTTQGSAGYVAIEQVQGNLLGKDGTFFLQHFATAQQGKQRLILEVVPDSGTGSLQGISGVMVIKIEGGDHYYEFDYSIP